MGDTKHQTGFERRIGWPPVCINLAVAARDRVFDPDTRKTVAACS